MPYPRNPVFTGRADALARLHTMLGSGDRVAITQPAAAISGMGGIGKTQTAVEYAYRHRNEYHFVLWMKSADEIALQESFVDVSRLLGLPEANEQDQNITIRAVTTWLSSHSGWLLILDNADDLSIAQPFLPKTFDGHILYTTRTLSGLKHAKLVRINKFDAEEGALLLLRRAGLLDAANQEDQDAARELSIAVDGLPLALDQAGAFIEEQNTSVARYLELYKNREAKLLADYGKLEDRDHDSVFATFSLAFDKANAANLAVGDLLRLCAFVAPDDIPEFIFTQADSDQLGEHLGPIVTDELAWEKLLGEACRYSLLSRDATKETLSLHRLVQVVLCNTMDEGEQRHWAERATGIVNHAFPNIKFENWPLCDQLLPNALVCSQWIAKLKIVTTQAGRMLNQTGYYLTERAQYDQAEPLYLEALDIVNTQLGSSHPDTALRLNNLAALYASQGRYSAAEPLYLEALEIRKRELGSSHPKTARTMNNLAALYESQGRSAEAEPLYLEALEIVKTQLGSSHPDTAASLNNLALLYDNQGRYMEAEPLYLEALEINERELGSSHPDTASSLNNLASFYYERGNYVQAKSYIEQALSIFLQVLGLEHPNTINSQKSHDVIVRALE